MNKVPGKEVAWDTGSSDVIDFTVTAAVVTDGKAGKSFRVLYDMSPDEHTTVHGMPALETGSIKLLGFLADVLDGDKVLDFGINYRVSSETAVPADIAERGKRIVDEMVPGLENLAS